MREIDVSAHGLCSVRYAVAVQLLLNRPSFINTMDVADDETRNVTVLMVMMTVMMMRWRRIISHLYSQTQPQNAEKRKKYTL